MKPYEDARQAIANKNFEAARDLLRTYIKEDSESAEVWYLAAQAAINDAQKVAFLEKAVELDPLHAHAANELYDLQHPEEMIILSEPQAETTHYDFDEAVPEIDDDKPHYAELEQRFGAFMLDQIILIIVLVPFVYILAVIFLGDGRDLSQDIAMARFISFLSAASVLVQGAYYAYCLTQREGQTIGKKMMNIRVIKRDGSALGLWDAVLRSIFGYSFSGMSFGIGFLWAVYDKQSQGWHDMIADTIVVQE